MRKPLCKVVGTLGFVLLIAGFTIGTYQAIIFHVPWVVVGLIPFLTVPSVGRLFDLMFPKN